MPLNIQINEYKSNKSISVVGGFFVFVKQMFNRMYVILVRKRAQMRVQKMLKNNIVEFNAKTAISTKQKNDFEITNTGNSLPKLGLSRPWKGVAAVFSVLFLALTIITSQYYGPQYIEAEILVQNFTKTEKLVTKGIELLKYDTKSVNNINSKTEFDAGTYTNGNFETTQDDLVAISAPDDYLTIGSYGDNVPDTSNNDWYNGGQVQTCSATSLQAGTFNDSQWNNVNNWVDLDTIGLTNGTGEYISEIMSAGASTAWTNITWTSSRPTFKELPNSLGVESVYNAGNVDMTNNTLLMHFNESSGAIVDNSGITGNGAYNGVLWSQSGRFNTSLGFDGVDDFVDLGQDLSGVIGGTASVAFWLNTTQVGLDVPWDAPGITGSEQAGTGDDVFWGYITSTGTIAIQAGNIAGAQSTTAINDGVWHHVVLTRNATTGLVEVYVDGILEDSATSETGVKTQYFDGIGRIYDNGGTHGYYQGDLDEISFWNTVMTSGEVYDQYRRGANRLKFQVRSCDDDACVGETFIGPDGTSATYYSEEMNSTVNLPSIALTNVPDNQYMQYRVDLETDNSTISPDFSCVTFNNGPNNTWIYRKCFNVDNTATGATNETEYQIYLDTDTSTLVTAGKMNADGSDIRFIDSSGNHLPYFIADDMNTISTRIWMQMDNIDAGVTEEVCMYYGNSGASAVSSRSDVFTYSAQADIYHVVANTAESTISEFASYSDNNDVSVGTYNNILNQYDNDVYPSGTLPTLSQTTTISTTDPISGGYNVDGTDNIVPASFAGTDFVYRMDRYTNQFSIVSPWCDASVAMVNDSGNAIAGSPFAVATGTAVNVTTNNTSTDGLPNDSAVIIEEVGGDCPVLITHHSTTGGDSFVMHSAEKEWYGVGSGNLEIAAMVNNTNITLYRSTGTTSTYTLNRGQHVYIAEPGSEGSEPAHRVVADQPIGVKAIADSDGGEATTFLPVQEMGYKYYFPEPIQYIAIATKENLSTTVDLYNDGTQCGVGAPDDTATVTPLANNPGKVYFGSTTDGTNIPAGACVIADNPIFAYYEFSTENDEHNAWNEKQNKQFVSPAPTYSVGTEENGSWSIDGTNTWLRRIPVTVNNTSATPLVEYQINIDLGVDISGIFANTQSDGGDLRVAGNIGDGTDNITYAVEDFDGTNIIGNMWVQVPSIGAASNTTIYLYYGATTTTEVCNQAQFNNGIYSDTQWNATSNWTELNSTGLTNGTGQYTSEIFNIGTSVPWYNIAWTSNRPTLKEMPNNAGVETVYGAGNIDMTGNVLLFHANEASGAIIDSSGQGNNGSYNGVGYSSVGKFNTALDFDGVNDEIVIPDANSLDFATEVTASTWVYLDSTNGWQSFFHKNINTANNFEVYFEQNNGVLYNYNTIQTATAVLTAGQWYHLAYTADATRERLYVDGQIVADEPVEYGGMSNTYDLYIGGSGGGGEQVDGRMDEMAMWNRALTPTEINDLYLRGANRLKFQVRSCNDAVCAGETFIGPDGTGTTYYTEETNNTVNLPVSSLTNVVNNQYFQFNTVFETDQNTTTPELSCVTIDRGTTNLTTTGNYDAIFHTTARKPNYYIVDERAVGETLSVISFADGNSVNDTFTTQIVDEGQIATIPEPTGITQLEKFAVTGPLHIGFDGNATESAIPISYAGTEFVYRVDRGADVFSFYAPFSDATIQIQESSTTGWTTLQTVSVATGTAQTVARDIVNTRAFKIISDVPILGFHEAGNNDSKILYPIHLGLEENSGNYELYGVGSGSLLLASSSDATVTIYRSDGTNSTITLNTTNNFGYSENGGGSQGTALGYHIVSDAPIGATSYADADGTEVVSFLSQKEFSREYVVTNPTQYMAIVARDANVTCRVYDDTGTEITTDGTGTMNNIPPQTGGTNVIPYPNKIHIGGSDTSDGAYFQAGYRMNCDEPVYAYYEHHLNGTISDETNWLTWPQVRKRAEVEPVVEDIDTVNEQGLFYESGKDSGTTGTNFEAYAEYTFDTTALLYGEHTYWRDITWEEIINSRSSVNGVNQVVVEVASADPVPNCTSAAYSPYITVTPSTLSTNVDSTLPYVTYTTNTQQIFLPDNFSDRSCLKMRVYLKTGDQAYAPKINSIQTNYYVPTLLNDQLNSPSIAVVGATGGNNERYRVLKALTNDTGLTGSQVFTTFENVSNASVFTQADLDLFEIPTQTINPQFTFPPFPSTTSVDAATASSFDNSNDVAVYFTNERSAGALETMNFIFNVDILSAGGPQISREFQLNISGL